MPRRWLVLDPEPPGHLIREAADIVAAGGVIAYPTDTLYGLAVHPWRQDAVDRLFVLKGRDARQPLPLIAADEGQVERSLGVIPPNGRRLARGFWPGPLTLVLRAPEGLPAALLAGQDTVAVRVPAHPVARGLARALGVPVTSTSANLSGRPATGDPGEVLNAFDERIDGILDAGHLDGGLPSTIVDVVGEVPRLVRAGAVPWERVVQFLSS